MPKLLNDPWGGDSRSKDWRIGHGKTLEYCRCGFLPFLPLVPPPLMFLAFKARLANLFRLDGDGVFCEDSMTLFESVPWTVISTSSTALMSSRPMSFEDDILDFIKTIEAYYSARGKEKIDIIPPWFLD